MPCTVSNCCFWLFSIHGLMKLMVLSQLWAEQINAQLPKRRRHGQACARDGTLRLPCKAPSHGGSVDSTLERSLIEADYSRLKSHIWQHCTDALQIITVVWSSNMKSSLQLANQTTLWSMERSDPTACEGTLKASPWRFLVTATED